MSFTGVLAQSTVTDLTAAERWYTTLLGGPPDARPMDGLLEWHLGEGFGVQVWREPDRAGRCTWLLATDDVDALATHLTDSGVRHDSVQPGGGARLLQLTDPDGNRVVAVG